MYDQRMTYSISMKEPLNSRETENGVLQVTRSGHLARGKVVRKLEKTLEDMFQVKHVIAVSSGTGGLHASLLALNIGKGNEIITSPFTFISPINMIVACGAKPVFVDIEDNYNLNTNQIEKKITKKTKAILTIDMFGLACNYKAIKQIAKQYNLQIISDSCQAFGARIGENFIPSYTDVTISSFFDTKTIRSGEGGAIFTNNTTLANNMRRIISHGQEKGKRYHYKSVGYNYRLTDLQAAVLLPQLKRLNQVIKRKQIIAKTYNELLENTTYIVRPQFSEKSVHTYSNYTIRILKKGRSNRKLQHFLASKSIETNISYPKPLHLCSHLAFLGYKKGDFPVAERFSREVLSLPIHSQMRKKDVGYVCNNIKAFFAQ